MFSKNYTLLNLVDNVLAKTICDVIDYNGKIHFDTSMPDSTPRKLLDTSKLNKLGWKAKTDLRDGLQKTYDWYQKHIATASISN